MLDISVLDNPASVRALLDPTRASILETLVDPGSATSVASALGLTRQKANYHFHALEQHDLIYLVEERPRRGLTERVMAASARSYVLSPAALGSLAADPDKTDRVSSSYLLSVAARLVGEVASLTKQARRANKPLATLTIDADIKFGSATARAEFVSDLTDSVNELAAKYHDEQAPEGRWHRLVIAAHPKPANHKDSAE